MIFFAFLARTPNKKENVSYTGVHAAHGSRRPASSLLRLTSNLEQAESSLKKKAQEAADQDKDIVDYKD